MVFTLPVPAMPYDQRAEDQRRDDGVDQPQKNVGDGRHPVRFRDVRERRAQRHAQQPCR